ncbi:MAG: 4'-phosphopantetheinyl transferase superfamily protein [Corallococcus sp.]|nr:4'-phosphopantetheinyl transferase superfamily protein [Corallococcus sp.]MCM1359404.1 4'-phosphopantetheinyl transferase superfamily protein [Corallococcus sp.]MCM1394847.1 4'-phosphopantetheinyl transferase superfamily protein [Corallococcus sp.]
MKISADNACTVYVSRVPNCEKTVLSKKNGLRSDYALRLLKYAYSQKFGLNAEEQNLRKAENGKWICDYGFASVSHSGNFVAVAVCTNAVGIDLQIKTAANEQTMRSIAKKLFCENEREIFENSANKTDAFFFTWCKKEALWKKLDEQPLTIREADTSDESFCKKKLTLEKDVYYLAVTEADSTIVFVDEKI